MAASAFLEDIRHVGAPVVVGEHHPDAGVAALGGLLDVGVVQIGVVVGAKQILAFCTTPKSKKELAVFCGFKDLRNFTLKHINPLLESGQLEMTIPDKPKSRNQKYITVRSE